MIRRSDKRAKSIWTLAALLMAAMASPLSAAAQATCGTGMLRDVEVVTERVSQPSVATIHESDKKKSGDRETRVFITPRDRENKTYLVTVRLRDVVYTGESSGNGFWNFDPTRLVINDPIEVCVYGNRLHLRRPDGKDFKTKVVRVIRDVNTPPGEPAARP
jgi:hypothetical protein